MSDAEFDRLVSIRLQRREKLMLAVKAEQAARDDFDHIDRQVKAAIDKMKSEATENA